MLRSPSSRDTCGLRMLHIKVNLLLYTCLLGALVDGILLDPPPSCIHRFERSYTRLQEEVMHKSTTTPSAREAWKRRRKKMDPGASGTTGPPDRYYCSWRSPVLPARQTGTTAPACAQRLGLNPCTIFPSYLPLRG